MRRLLMILLGLAVITGFSAGPAMAIQIHTGTSASPGTVLFYDDFESAVLGGDPNNGSNPGNWVTPIPHAGMNTIDTSVGGVGVAWAGGGTQSLFRTEQSGTGSRTTLTADFANTVNSGPIHFETMFRWRGADPDFGGDVCGPNNNPPFGNNPCMKPFTPLIKLTPEGVDPDTGGASDGNMFKLAILHNKMYWNGGHGGTHGTGYLSNLNFNYDGNDWFKVEIDHEVGQQDFIITVTDMVNDPDGNSSKTQTATRLVATTNIGRFGFDMGNEYAHANWDNVGAIVPEPATALMLVVGLLSLACWPRRKRD